MFNWNKNKRADKQIAEKLYFQAVEQARQPEFYEEMNVPDSFDGRFEMISLHVFLVMNTLKDRNKRRAQALFDAMFRNVDLTLREMGIGDLSVPKHMRKMMKAYNGRAHSYQKALNEEEDLKEVLKRNVYGTAEEAREEDLDRLAAYVHESIMSIKDQSLEEGNVIFPALTVKEVSYG